jgi:hypothetical protein
VSTAVHSLLRKAFLALALILLVSGCAAPPSALTLIPVTGSNSPSKTFEIHEYPLVEQSIDNPTHAAFQDRVPQAVAALRGSWRFPITEDIVHTPNETLAAFGFRLESNPTPPFSGYALYQGQTEIQRDIARFWPVSVKNDSSAQDKDFLLAFETLSGERLVASINGIEPWPGQEQSASGTPPVFYKGRIAYAQTVNGELSVIAGTDVIYADYTAGEKAPRSLLAWDHPAQGSHWALDLDGRVIIDGQDLSQTAGYEEIFHWQVIQQQPFFFFVDNGLTHLNYAGKVQPFYYDLVVHGSQDVNGLFNPGSNDRMVWFYALRDGLWYYVEAQAK